MLAKPLTLFIHKGKKIVFEHLESWNLAGTLVPPCCLNGFPCEFKAGGHAGSERRRKDRIEAGEEADEFTKADSQERFKRLLRDRLLGVADGPAFEVEIGCQQEHVLRVQSFGEKQSRQSTVRKPETPSPRPGFRAAGPPLRR